MKDLSIQQYLKNKLFTTSINQNIRVLLIMNNNLYLKAD